MPINTNEVNWDAPDESQIQWDQPTRLEAARKQGEQDAAGIWDGIKNFAHGVAKGAADNVQVPAQLLANSYSKLYSGIPVVGDWFKTQANQMNQRLANQEGQYQAETPGSIAAGAGRVLAGSVPFMLTGGSSAVAQAPKAVGALGSIANASKAVMLPAIKGAGYSTVTQPVTDATTSPNGDSDFFQKKAMQAGFGALGSLFGAGIGNVAGRMIKPNPSQEVQALVDQGINPTLGQMLGGGFKRAEEAATSIPVLGDMIKNAQRRSIEDLNRAAVNQALKPINAALPKGVMGRDAIDYAGKQLGDAYDTVLGKIGATVPDAQFGADLASLSALTKNLPQSNYEQFGRIIQNEILDRLAKGAITSDGLKAAESNLGQMAKNYMRDQNYDNRQMGLAIQEAQNTLRNLVQRTNPQAADELQKINAGYAKYLRAQRAAASLGAEEGTFTPAQLQNAVKAMDTSRNKGAFAKGDALMQDLSEPAKSVLGNKLPDSGTPFRHAVQAGIAGIAGHSMMPGPVGAMMVPAVAGMGIASLPYTGLGQKLATAALTKRPQSFGALSNIVRSGAPLAGAGSMPTILEFMND